MSEKRFRRTVLEILSPVGAFPVENTAHDGTPDLVCVLGWLELKVAQRPVRPGNLVRVDLRNSQRIWLRKWRQHGGRAWTLTKLEELWLLHDALWSCDHLGTTTEFELRQHAIASWQRTPSFEELAGSMRVQTHVN